MNQSPLECPAQFMFDARRRTLPSWKGPSAGELSTVIVNSDCQHLQPTTEQLSRPEIGKMTGWHFAEWLNVKGYWRNSDFCTLGCLLAGLECKMQPLATFRFVNME